ncbi:MAG: Unknown protein [uncultured Sulfurovum sp.]|uniref:Uncharacterized protein n=1 Tax=uncultured Sulfurovum sp. TaxID=269237 RepID=A0A6S6U034_9BACT|nr:MAG: Unknown protein [uncultured Sulfurovum sp.]CAA6826232.1 MAG: Unknown protein [uncultured Sulfurovum sp.]
MYKRLPVIFMLLVGFIFSACDSSENRISTNIESKSLESKNLESEKMKTAVLGVEVKDIPFCSIDGISSALEVKAKSKIEKQGTETTKIKIWHYQDSSEFLCLLSGDAVVVIENN